MLFGEVSDDQLKLQNKIYISVFSRHNFGVCEIKEGPNLSQHALSTIIITIPLATNQKIDLRFRDGIKITPSTLCSFKIY